MRFAKLFLCMSAVLLISSCERVEPGFISGDDTVRFNVSESFSDLSTKGEDAPGTLTLTSEDGRTIRLIAVEEAFPLSPGKEEAASTKAAKVYNSNNRQELDFAVWAYNTNSQNNFNTSTWQLDAGTGSSPVKVKYNNNAWSPWDVTTDKAKTIKYSSLQGWYARWFAVGPWDAYDGSAVSGLNVAQGVAPRLTYTVPEGKIKVEDRQHWDLMAAMSDDRDATDTSPVDLNFCHVLTGIRFKRDAGLNITNIKINGVYGSATLNMTKLPEDGDLATFTNVDDTGDAKDLWSGRGSTNGTYEMDMASEDWVENIASADANIMMMIPQWTPGGAKITVTIDDKFGVTDFTGDISGHRWRPGRLVTYRIDEPERETFTITIQTDASHRSITLPLTAPLPANTVVKWGDGEIGEFAAGYNGAISHSYDENRDGKPTIIEIKANEIKLWHTDSPWFNASNAYPYPDYQYLLREISSPLPPLTPDRLQGLFYNFTNLTTVCENLFENNTATNNFEATFRGCTSLKSIPEKLFEKNTAATCFDATFSGCTSLASIPDKLFEKNTAATDFEHVFQDCTSLASIPDKLFEKNTAAYYFNDAFRGCTSLKSIPEGLFETNTLVSDYYNVFRDCTGLESITGSLFNASAKGFLFVFTGCTSLKSISEKLFEKSTAATWFQSVFTGCKSLESIPEKLFEKNTAATDFIQTFQSCHALTEIPEKLFEKNTKVTSFDHTFYACINLKTIPENLFKENKSVDSFEETFNMCHALTSIPENLFKENTAVTSFKGTFESCTSLESIPDKLFETNTAVTTFEATFYGCSKVTKIPDKLFEMNTAVKHFDYTLGRLKITEIPVDLFKENKGVETFDYTFASCSSLESIPETLFKENKGVTSFKGTFGGCGKITEIPVDLFKENRGVKHFDYTFYGSQATIPEDLFKWNEDVESFNYTFYMNSFTSIPENLFKWNKNVMSFDYTFQQSSKPFSIPENLFKENTAVTSFKGTFNKCPLLTGNAPQLWVTHPSANGSGCFYNCSGLSNYSAIPAGWK